MMMTKSYIKTEIPEKKSGSEGKCKWIPAGSRPDNDFPDRRIFDPGFKVNRSVFILGYFGAKQQSGIEIPDASCPYTPGQGNGAAGDFGVRPYRIEDVEPSCHLWG
jgi:hypothetical protein